MTKKKKRPAFMQVVLELRDLKRKIQNAYANATRQQRRLDEGLTDVRVRPDFWRQVAYDYEKQLHEKRKEYFRWLSRPSRARTKSSSSGKSRSTATTRRRKSSTKT